MSTEKPQIPFTSALDPTLLGPSDSINFNCHKGISCFNACCKHADLMLTPYDIIRLKNRLGMSSTDFLAKHAVPFEMDGSGTPGLKMRTEDEQPVCLFVTDEGCSVYQDRPSACRYYPVGLMSMRAKDAVSEEAHYFLVKEDHCKGHAENNTVTIQQYREEQGVEEYDELNKEWYQIMLKKRSSGPVVGKPSETSLQMFFMCSYDIDRFRRFVMSDSFKTVYDLDETTFAEFNDDIKLMKFGFRLLKQVLFGENTIPEIEGALEKRLEDRKEHLDLRRKMEIEAHQHNSDPYKSLE